MKITIEHISKSFDKKTKVLNDLNLVIEDNSLTTLLGYSGCGKTTLLRIISGLEKADEGRIIFDDTVVFDSDKKIDVPPSERGIGFVFQDFALWPNMSVIKNVEFAIENTYKNNIKTFFKDYKVRRKEIEERALDALRKVRMEEYKDRMVSKLSGGQKQRVSIARAISINPKVILFDEPFSALDAKLRESMRIEIRELIKDIRMTSIFVTHDQIEAMAISDNIIVMNNGQISRSGKPVDIYYHPNNKFIADFIGKASYIDKNHFLRPEQIAIDDNGFATNVYSCICLGGRYEVVSKDSNNISYIFYSDKFYPLGSAIKISYKEVCVLEEKN